MKISKLFHWLYAIIMLSPILIWVGNVLVNFGTGSPVSDFENSFNFAFASGSVFDSVEDAYRYLCVDVFGFSSSPWFVSALAYWTIVSVVYLVFDVLMFLPLLAHSWIDKARVE